MTGALLLTRIPVETGLRLGEDLLLVFKIGNNSRSLTRGLSPSFFNIVII